MEAKNHITDNHSAEAEEWAEYSRQLREKLAVWEERLGRLKGDPTAAASNKRLATAIGSLESNADRVRRELEGLERARLGARPRKWLAIRNEIEARLRAMEREWERRPAA